MTATQFRSIDGEIIDLKDFSGKPVLVVNTASMCGFTPQYDDLQELWTSYKPQGLTVIGVPSNDFGGQEPKSEGEIKTFCELKFNVDFPLTARTKVKGNDAHPFFVWARDTLGADGTPRWNFHKILIGRNGQPVAGFGSSVAPNDPALLAAIKAEL
jgi:glutathione peroxidase